MTTAEALRCGWKGKQAEDFAVWRTEIDKVLRAKIGLIGDDLEDFEYAGAFTDEMTPEEAAQEILESSGRLFFLLPYV